MTENYCQKCKSNDDIYLFINHFCLFDIINLCQSKKQLDKKNSLRINNNEFLKNYKIYLSKKIPTELINCIINEYIGDLKKCVECKYHILNNTHKCDKCISLYCFNCFEYYKNNKSIILSFLCKDCEFKLSIIFLIFNMVIYFLTDIRKILFTYSKIFLVVTSLYYIFCILFIMVNYYICIFT
jgi:hypothetical protein